MSDFPVLHHALLNVSAYTSQTQLGHVKTAFCSQITKLPVFQSRILLAMLSCTIRPLSRHTNSDPSPPKQVIHQLGLWNKIQIFNAFQNPGNNYFEPVGGSKVGLSMLY